MHPQVPPSRHSLRSQSSGSCRLWGCGRAQAGPSVELGRAPRALLGAGRHGETGTAPALSLWGENKELPLQVPWVTAVLPAVHSLAPPCWTERLWGKSKTPPDNREQAGAETLGRTGLELGRGGEGGGGAGGTGAGPES